MGKKVAKEEKVLVKSMIFIDSSNFYIPAKDKGLKVDLFLLRDLLSKNKTVIQTHYFSSVDQKNAGQLRFIRKLKEKNFIVHTSDLLFRKKEAKCRTCGTEQPVTLKCQSCGADVELPPHQSKEIDIKIAKWLLLSSNSFDEAIIVSGDRDFVPIIKHLRTQLAKRIIIVSYKDSCSYLYKEFADEIIDFESIENKVTYPYDKKK